MHHYRSKGLFLVSIKPNGKTYFAEIVNPASEGTCNRLIQFFDQASVIFVTIKDQFKTNEGLFTASLLLMVGLLVISTGLILFMKDPGK